jgi:hypothetical protein
MSAITCTYRGTASTTHSQVLGHTRSTFSAIVLYQTAYWRCRFRSSTDRIRHWSNSLGTAFSRNYFRPVASLCPTCIWPAVQ